VSRRTGDGGESSAASVLGERVAQARREGKRSRERCGETRWRCSQFNTDVNGFNAIEDGEDLRGDLREGK
jgi:hypothetical protein